MRSRALWLGASLAVVLAASCGKDELIARSDAGGFDASAGRAGSAADGAAAAGGIAGEAGQPSDAANDLATAGSGGLDAASSDAASEVGADVESDGLAGVGGQLADAGDGGPVLMPDFGLYDVNPSSPRYQQLVSPKDYSGQVSAWYFGHAT